MIDVGELYEQHAREIWGYCQRRLTADEADDVAASVWARAWERRESYAERGLPPMAWVYRIAHNMVIDYVRVQQKRRAGALELIPDGEHPCETDPDPFAHADLHAAVDKLTPDQRSAVILRYWEGESIAVTASKLGTSDDGVKKRLSRAWTNLGKMLEGAA